MSAQAKISVLVVEDEPFVRLDLAHHLDGSGYTVHEAATAAEAIEILERDPTIRVVFTDVRMPGDMDGIALARTIRKRWPPTLIVICSANITEPNVDLADIHILNKPYAGDELDMLLGAVQQQLSGT